ncbi:beta-ketoacyl synthase N-terminal-like domain-containing protein [Streptomyces avermitilis]|uniref:beta-ketoacyl synthase N-terminal-like domain-containing protein n=1 Tax=Streptomyces avermitilis TaxID=33903 RepID=UPI00382820C1
MTSTAHRTVCVTGMSWDTALGDGLDTVWRRLLDGDTGMVPLSTEDHPGLRARLAARLARPVAPGAESDRHTAVAVRTAARALEDAALGPDEPDPLLVLATSLGPHADLPQETSLHRWAEDTGKGLGLAGAPLSLSTACSSGADAVATAAALVRSGKAARCLVGGVDLLTEAKLQGHSALSTLSPTVLRAFDEERDGTLLGEGAAFLVLEPLSAALTRGARVHGLVRGWGSSNDAVGLSSPDVTGSTAEKAITRALALAGAAPGQVGAVNAHATGTLQNDEAEANCLRRVFGEGPDEPVAFATKGAFGHTLGATGIIEAVVTLLALRDGVVPPVANLRTPMSGFPLPLSLGGPRDVVRPLGLSLTLGFGGFNTCLAFEGTSSL